MWLVLVHLVSSVAVQRIAIGAGGLAFNSRAGQIDHSVGQSGLVKSNGSPPLRRFFGAVLPRR